MSIFSKILDVGKSLISPIIGGIAGVKAADKSADVQQQINDQNIAFQRETNAQNEALAREFAKMGVRWKVEDARAAGLHPLSALGISGSASPPILVSPQAQFGGSDSAAKFKALGTMGQDISRALLATESADAKIERLTRLEVAQAAIAKDHAQAAYYHSLANRANVEVYPLPDLGFARARPLNVETTVEGKPVGGGAAGRARDSVQYEPDKVVSAHSRDSSRSAGEHPLWQTMRHSDMPGRRRVPMDIYRTDDPSEQFSEGGVSMRLELIKRNVQRYGWGWLLDYIYPRKSGHTGRW